MSKASQRGFYNRIAKKFGGNKSPAAYVSHFPGQKPEEIFLHKMIRHSHQQAVALDIGCGDGRFTLNAAKYFKKIYGIDTSTRMLEHAKALRRKSGIKNVVFLKKDAYCLPFKRVKFDCIYSRRGPTPYENISKMIKKGGIYVEISIGEQDAREIKEVFKRGQGYKEWNRPLSTIKKITLTKAGFKVVFLRNYFYREVFPDVDNLIIFLQSVPIFWNYNKTRDKTKTNRFVQKTKKTSGHIELKRHRIVFVARYQ